MNSEKFEALLQERMGLDARSIGTTAVERAVRARAAACGIATADEYWEHLQTSQAEVQELIEAIVVPETWFFRDREAFITLVRIALGEWLPANSGGSMRILSLPCATGEEPFSIAMALLDAYMPADRFQIDAVDISRRALTFAQNGEYGKNSFRGADLAFRARHFERCANGYRLNAAVRRQVRFRQANLFESGALTESQSYDAIFCRNVLIYFNRHDQQIAVQLLGRLLTPTGIVFVGPSESALLLDQGFVSAKIPLAFAFGLPLSPPARAALERHPRPLAAPAKTAGPAKTVAHAKTVAAPRAQRIPFARQPEPAAARAEALEADDWLEAARRLADAGKLVEAMQLCERNLQESAPSAQAFYLTGLLHDAAERRVEAEDFYRKALYLDPQYPEALAHLGAALMRDGDERGAHRLFDRAKRARGGGRPA